MRERVEALGVPRGATVVHLPQPLRAAAARVRGRARACRRTSPSTTRDDQLRLVKEAMRGLRRAADELPPGRPIARPSRSAKNELLTPAGLRAAGRRLRAAGRWPRSTDVYERLLAGQQRPGLRRPADADGLSCCATGRRSASALGRRLPLHPDRRVPGHQPRAVPHRPRHRDGAPEHLRHRRPGPEHLRLARGGHPQHPGVRAGLPQRQGRPPGGELPLDRADPGRGRRADRPQPPAQGQDALDQPRGRAEVTRGRLRRRARRGRRGGPPHRRRSPARAAATATWPSSTASTASRACWRTRCGSAAFPTASPAAWSSTTARRSRTCWRTCGCWSTPPTT